jgi:hypothetical protein
MASLYHSFSGLISAVGLPSASRLAVLALLGSGALHAQPVPRTVVVEHFTNTVCSICASRNPGFYANLRQQPSVLHIAYHPSSPYRACLFSQQNTVENDARTNFYGVYGGTPRLVINGTVIPATDDYATAALFAPFQGQASPFAVSVALRPSSPDSITATVRVLTQALHSYPTLQLYVALVEDTVNYAGPNGEQRHFDVFRKSFTGASPLAITPAAGVGAAVVLTRVVFRNPGWRPNHLYAVAMVQEAGNAMLQAAASPRFSTVLNSAATTPKASFQAYPNPTSGTISLTTDLGAFTLELYNSMGQLLHQRPAANSLTTLDVRHLAPGQYFLRAVAPNGQRYLTRFVKQ